MICSSVNLDRFIVRPLSGDGLYSNLEEVQGLRSFTNEVCEAALAHVIEDKRRLPIAPA